MESQSVLIVYKTNHPSQRAANKKYRDNNKSIINERARLKYENDKEYNERKKLMMRERYNKKKLLKSQNVDIVKSET